MRFGENALATIDRVKEQEATADCFDEALWAKLAEANLLAATNCFDTDPT